MHSIRYIEYDDIDGNRGIEIKSFMMDDYDREYIKNQIIESERECGERLESIYVELIDSTTDELESIEINTKDYR